MPTGQRDTGEISDAAQHNRCDAAQEKGERYPSWCETLQGFTMAEEKTATRGAMFADHAKLISIDDDRPQEKGLLVCIAGRDKVYGPYMLDREVGRGNGKVTWVAFSTNTNGTRTKPKTKAELEQEAAAKQAAILKTVEANPELRAIFEAQGLL